MFALFVSSPPTTTIPLPETSYPNVPSNIPIVPLLVTADVILPAERISVSDLSPVIKFPAKVTFLSIPRTPFVFVIFFPL